jgi:hypothetical protein
MRAGCDKEENVAVTGAAAAASCLKEDCKTFCPKSRIRPVTAKLASYPVNTSHRSKCV